MGIADRVTRNGPSPGHGRGADVRQGALADISSGNGTRFCLPLMLVDHLRQRLVPEHVLFHPSLAAFHAY